jgi:hypothetical protein
MNRNESRFCNCPDWEPCGCGHQPPYHCMWCCLELTKEQFAKAIQDGRYRRDLFQSEPPEPQKPLN